MALPLRDDLVPRRFPWVTLALFAINVVVFLFVQPSAFQNPPNDYTSAEARRGAVATEYAMRWGAVACELRTGELVAEILDGRRTPDALSPNRFHRSLAR